MTLPGPTRLAWLREYTRTNPLLALWALMLFCGGSVLLSYHARLAYLPDFNLVELAGLMASVTLIGLMLIVLFLSSCFLPGLTLRWIEHSWPLVPYRRYFHMSELVFVWLAGPFFWAAYLWLPELIPSIRTSQFTSGLFFVVLISGAIVAALWLPRSRSAAFKIKHWKYRLASRHAVAFCAWISLFIFPMSAALTLASAGDASQEISVAIQTVFLLTVFNGVAYAASFSEIRTTIGVDGLVAAVVMVFALGIAVVFPQQVMQSLALGHRHAATLTISGKNCHALARFGVQCTRDDSKDGAIELENINVLSRVGTTVLLELLVQPASSNAAATLPVAARTGALTLFLDRRRVHCPASSGGGAACTACDPRLLQRAGADKAEPGGYRDQLICVQITVPKEDILNIAFGNQRHYSGYSTFTLPGQAETKQTAP